MLLKPGVTNNHKGSMESHSLLPSNNIKVEPVSEMGKLNNIKPDPASEVRLSNSIKPEPAIETGCAASSAGDILTEIPVCDQMESKMPASVKIEPPEVYIDYPDQELHSCSQTCPSLQEQTQRDKKMVFDNMDWKLEINPSSEGHPSISIQEHSQMEICGNTAHMKQELSDVSCVDRSQTLSKIVDKEGCDINQEMVGHCNEESRLTENCYKASVKYGNCCQVSENMFSFIKINEKLPVTNKSYQLQNVGTVVKHTQTSVKPLDDTVCYVSCSYGTQAGDTPYISNVCDPADSLNRHKRTQTAPKPYKCDDCGTSFARKQYLNNHKKIHTEEKPYKCDYCRSSFTTAQSLMCHKRIHPGEKPYKCDDCGTSFTRVNSLNCHKKIHTGEKPYKCEYCGASFTTRGILNRHKNIHTRDKPYKCEYCDESFPTVNSLTCHKRTHAEEKPYKCEECGANFILNSHLKHHKSSLSGSIWCSSYRRLHSKASQEK